MGAYADVSMCGFQAVHYVVRCSMFVKHCVLLCVVLCAVSEAVCCLGIQVITTAAVHWGVELSRSVAANSHLRHRWRQMGVRGIKKSKTFILRKFKFKKTVI